MLDAKEHKKVGSLFFHKETPDEVCDILAKYRGDFRNRLRIWCGDTETGEAWEEEYDTMGFVGCSTGPQSVPLLLATRRSLGGGAILDHKIVAIQDITGNKWLYKHPTFSVGVWEVVGTTVTHNGKAYAACETMEKASRLAEFMAGRRNAK